MYLQDMETRERIQKEMEEYAHSQASDSAAIEAFNNMGTTNVCSWMMLPGSSEKIKQQ